MTQRDLDRLRADRRVEHVDDERAIGNSIIVSLRDGWCFQEPGTHVFGEDTATAVRISMRSVKVCACAVCCAALAEKRRPPVV